MPREVIEMRVRYKGSLRRKIGIEMPAELGQPEAPVEFHVPRCALMLDSPHENFVKEGLEVEAG
jgi:hypothetical protein